MLPAYIWPNLEFESQIWKSKTGSGCLEVARDFQRDDLGNLMTAEFWRDRDRKKTLGKLCEHEAVSFISLGLYKVSGEFYSVLKKNRGYSEVGIHGSQLWRSDF